MEIRGGKKQKLLKDIVLGVVTKNAIDILNEIQIYILRGWII